MRRVRGKWIAISVAGAVAIVLGGVYGVFALQSGGGPDPVSLSSVAAGPSSTGSLEGSWTIGSGSFAGYRVREKLAFLPAPSDAVGRTTAVRGSLTISGLNVSAADVTADLTQLHSDRSMRDERIRTIGLETSSYPTARFVLSSPIRFDAKPASGATVRSTARGSLSLHGVTNAVSLPIQATWSGEGIEVIGSLDIGFADYGIVPPNVGPVSVQDHGTIEFHLSFVKG